MATPKSFRLPETLANRLEAQAARAGVTQTDLVITLLDEGLKTHDLPGVVYRDGPTGRRVGLAAGPDIWEVISALQHAQGTGAAKVDYAAEVLSLSGKSVHLAVEFYSRFPDEVDARIQANAAAAADLQAQASRRENLLA